jgi:hypothetical protein
MPARRGGFDEIFFWIVQIVKRRQKARQPLEGTPTPEASSKFNLFESISGRDQPFAALAVALDAELGEDLANAVAALRSGAIEAVDFADAAWALINGEKSPGRGAYSTPWPLARWLSVQAGKEGATVLDPACGCGHLLIAAAADNSGRRPEAYFGWDTCSESVQATRIGLWLASGRNGRVSDFANLHRADALFSAPDIRVDTIVSNPPFVSIRHLARSHGPAYVGRLRDRFKLTGSFDLFVPFLLSFERWLAANGRFAAIIPAAFWSTCYAEPARRRLAEHIEAVHRFCDRALFPGASVSPQIIVGGPADEQPLRIFDTRFVDGVVRSSLNGESPRQRTAESGFPVDRSQMRPVTPLGNVATVRAGTPGYTAHRMASHIVEAGEAGGQEVRNFVVSRCIEPYHVRLGPVRFMKRRFHQPVVPVSSLTKAKRELFTRPKLLVAGVARSLTAARDAEGLALGVGVYAILPERVAPELLLALLNSRSVSAWYRLRFPGSELSGGFYGVTCHQLRALNVPTAWVDGRGSADEVIELVRKREAPTIPSDLSARHLDRTIERLVTEALYKGDPIP